MDDDLTDLDAAAALAAAVTSRRAADSAEADLLVLAAHWADLHAVAPGAAPAGDRVGPAVFLDGAEQLVPLAGEGTPQVAEFAPGELGAALSISTHAATRLVGDALELRHRLPRLWARVQAGQLPAWRARQVAEHTNTLSRQAAGFVDAQVAPYAHKIGLQRVLTLVDVAIRRFDPELAAARERARADGRGVWATDTMTDGTRSVHIEADALDVHAFDTRIEQIAATLATLGDPDRRDLRRAKALGVIADPQATLDLLHPDPDHPTPTTMTPTHPTHPTPQTAVPAAVAPAVPRTGRRSAVPTEAPDAHPGAAGGRPTGRSTAPARRPPRSGAGSRRRVALYVHLSQAAVTARSGIARVEGLGPATLELVRDWLGRPDLDIDLTPVLDLDNRTAVDAYETPDPIRETVLVRNPCCPFPWCVNLSRRKDMDHIIPYLPPDQGGPPGQTAAHLLGSPCRRHHRYKTSGGWSYSMPEPGLHLWRSPQGRRYLVDHTGSTNLDDQPT